MSTQVQGQSLSMIVFSQRLLVRWCSWAPVLQNMLLLCWQHWTSTITRWSLGLQQKKTIIGPKNKKRCLIYVHKTITLEDERINLICSPTCDLLVFAFFSFTTMIIQIVSQSLVTHMKSSLILEELKWFNLVNGSGTFPTPAQVFKSCFFSSKTFLIFLAG